jgi:lathosterol oxidase
MSFIIFSIVSYDIWFYVSHLILHSAYFYKYHKEHHKNKINLVYTDTYVGHPFESAFQGIGVLIPYMYYGSLYELAITLALINIRGMMRHDHRCAWLIGNHHLLHHEYPGYNYGEYWIDFLCGTCRY